MKSLGKKMGKVSLITMLLIAFATIAGVANTAQASPAIEAFFDNLNGFNDAAGSPPVVVDFEGIAQDTDITDRTINGVKFEMGNLPSPSARLKVVKGIDTFTPSGFMPPGSPANKLFATSGENVLSPGGKELAPGPNPTVENDDIVLKLSTPVWAIGFDILHQSLDGQSFISITVLDDMNRVIYTKKPIPIKTLSGTPPPGGHTFVGFVSDSNNIAKIIIDEFDDNNINPDSNIGLDTIRLGTCNLNKINGHKFNDMNGDGKRQSGEPGLEGWKIKLTGFDTCTGKAVSKDTTTDATGLYEFRGVTVGNYVVSEVIKPGGWVPTTPPAVSANVPLVTAPSVIVTRDFGNRQLLLPDLVVDSVRSEGGKLKFTVRNIGLAPAGSSITHVQFFDPGHPKPVPGPEFTLLTPEPPATELPAIIGFANLDVPIPTQCSTFTFRCTYEITADFDKKISESNENNNVAGDRNLSGPKVP